MSRLRIELVEGEHNVEVLQINGGTETVLGVLDASDAQSIEVSIDVEVAAPTSIVLREVPAQAAVRFAPSKESNLEQ